MANSTDWIQEFREVKKYGHRYITENKYKDIYEFYTKKYKKKVDYKRYKKLCLTFNKILSDKIIRESFEFKLPYRSGSIRIKAEKQNIKFKDGKVDTRAMGINWPASHKMWRETWPDKTYKEIMAIPNKKVLVYTNDHSNGYIMKWYWDKRLSNMKNQSVYIFRPVKGQQDAEYYLDEKALYFGRRGLASWIKNDYRTNEYFE